jgi:nitroreductase
MEKNAITSVSIDPLLAKRWSLRAFDSEKPVSREHVISICEAGRWAPSCFGDEPWRFIVWDKNYDIEKYEKAFRCLGEWNQRWAKNAPVLILACADTKFRRNRESNRWAQFDSGAACENIYLQAFALGLAAHPMGGFDENMIKGIFEIPDDFIPMAMIAVGYQTDFTVLEEEFQKSELAERFRRPIGTTFFDSAWDKPILENPKEK